MADKHYTDEDVEAGVRILMQPRMHTNMAGDKQRADLRAVLDAVAPAIAARALREAADYWQESARINPLWLREMADEIEGKPWYTHLLPADDEEAAAQAAARKAVKA